MAYPSKVKNVFIHLPNYRFKHSPNEDGDNFIGRTEVMERLSFLLEPDKFNSSNRFGVYLIAGYRGVGKTTLVNKVLKEKEKIYTKISINLSQDNIKEIDVLRLMAINLSLSISDSDKRIYKIKIKLDQLIQRINAQCRSKFDYPSIEQNKKGQKKVLEFNYDFITPKDIERELIDILEEIESNRNNQKYFVFVIDELDKIEPNFLYDANSLPNDELDNQIHGINKVRKRQETIAKILASLKSFLNTAKAKFIFIGGHEMYDASLADVADRDSFYSSIFHECLYVNSFFKDKIYSTGGVTRMTEAFLCQLILQSDELDKYRNNKDYYNLDRSLTIKNIIERFKPTILTNDELEELENKRKIFKLINILQNYIIYLTYRSNGLPKKLINLIEKDIIYLNKSQITDDSALKVCLLEAEEEGFYLKFSFKSQYEIGLTANLYRPYLNIHSRYLKTLNDRLLYSSAYIIDFLLKYHPYGFSWKNIESIPDIILASKDPNLRPFIKDILEYLQGMYVRPTISGMHEYKYFSRVSAEISYLCKTSDSASAAFNFTLDETLHIKRYYLNRLKILEKSNDNKKDQFDFSIQFIQSTLGDLYFFDAEYDEAIIYYSRCIEFLHPLSEGGNLSLQQIIIFVKAKLRLGLAHQKIHNYDRAYVIYRSLILKIPSLLAGNINKIMAGNLTHSILNSAEEHFIDEKWEIPLSRLHILMQPHIALLETIEKDRKDGITYDNLLRNESELLKFIGYNSTKQKDKIRMHTLLSDYFLGVGNLLYYKNYNYIQLYEKLKMSPIKLNLGTLDYFSFLKNISPDKLDYNPSISACVYYRWALNQKLKQYDELLINKDYGMNDYQKAVKLLTSPYSNHLNNENLLYLANLFTKIGDSLLTMVSLDSVLQNFTNKDQFKNFEIILENFEFNIFEGSLIGDLGINREEEKNNSKFRMFNLVVDLLRFYENAFDENNRELDDINIENIELRLMRCYDFNRPLLMYYISGQFFMKAGSAYSYAAQLKKSLSLIKDCISFFNRFKSKNKEFIFTNLKRHKSFIECLENIAVKHFNAITWASNISVRPQLLKYREIFEKRHDAVDTPLTYANLTTSHETKEVILIIEEIKLIYESRIKHGRKNNLERVKKLISPYSSVSNMMTRILELRLQANVLFEEARNSKLDVFFKIFTPLVLEQYTNITSIEKHGCSKLLLDILNNSDENVFNDRMNFERQFKVKISGNEALLRLLSQKNDFKKMNLENLNSFKKFNREIIEAIFCLSQIIKTLNIYGHTYMSSYSYLANTHHKMANWCLAYRNYVSLFSKSNIEKDLSNIMGSDGVYLEHNYHYELAIKYYYHALEAHKSGKPYKNLTENMSYLEDDYNDNLFHFSAASERFRINTGVIRSKIDELKVKVKRSKLYDYNNYFVK